MKANQPCLPASLTNDPLNPQDPRAISVIRSVIDSTYTISQVTISSPSIQRQFPIPVASLFCLYYASMLLIAHSNNALDDQDWLVKVESFRVMLRMASGRWKVAGELCFPADD